MLALFFNYIIKTNRMATIRSAANKQAAGKRETKQNNGPIAARSKNLRALFNRIAAWITHKTGSPASFVIAALLVVAWGLSGPIFHFSDTWQLVINTSTSIITFLMVFIIQQSQNKDTAAIHLKLNELIASAKTASNRLIDSEDLSEEELLLLKKFYIKLSEKSWKDSDTLTPHPPEEPEKNNSNRSDNK